MDAKSKDCGAQPTSFNKTKLNSTSSETSSETKAATQGKPNNSTARDQSENHSSSKKVTRSSSRQASHEKDPDWKPGPGGVTVEASGKPNTRPAASRWKPIKFKDYFMHKDKNKDQGDDVFEKRQVFQQRHTEKMTSDTDSNFGKIFMFCIVIGSIKCNKIEITAYNFKITVKPIGSHFGK